MKICRTPAEMQAWSAEQRAAGQTIGFVPTMGALHEGHASLMRASVAQNDVSVLSIYVNPTQFAPTEDLDQYPRTWDADSALAEEIGIDAVYFPSDPVMYPEGYATYVTVEGLTDRLCGASRPTHFQGVTTIVAKLFNAVLPTRAYFGQKDAQQFAVIKRMTQDLDFGIELVEMPIVREADGLAMSSRNKYLSDEERQRALCLSRSLNHAKDMLDAGERDEATLLVTIRQDMADVDVDYVEIVGADTIAPLETFEGTILIAVAARLGETRLIDNLKYTIPETAS